MVQDSTKQYKTVQNSTKQYKTVQDSTTTRNEIKFDAIPSVCIPCCYSIKAYIVIVPECFRMFQNVPEQADSICLAVSEYKKRS